MSINSRSLIFRLGLFFALMLLLINLLLLFEHDYRNEREHSAMLERYGHIMHTLRDSGTEPDLSPFGVRRAPYTPEEIHRKGRELQHAPFGTLYELKGSLYFVGCMPPEHGMDLSPPDSVMFPPEGPGLRPEPPRLPGTWTEPPKGPIIPDREHCIALQSFQETDRIPFLVLMTAANLVLILFFAYFIRKLLPLRRLEGAIARLDEHGDPVPLRIEGRDEIARIAAQYNSVRERMQAMKEARALFLRNILHELKTPFMKGKLLSDYIEEPGLKQRFERLFERMEFVLGELGQIERLTSGNWELECHPYRLGDLYDHAYDLLLRDETRIVLEGERTRMIEADFEYFGVALKNLLDNALRYGAGPVTVRFSDTGIDVCSPGEPLEAAPDAFTRPFNRRFEGGGLGLGLYITHTIAARHGFMLRYRHEAGENCFGITWKPGSSHDTADSGEI